MVRRHSRSMEANVEHNGGGTCCPKKGENLWLRTAYCLQNLRCALGLNPAPCEAPRSLLMPHHVPPACTPMQPLAACILRRMRARAFLLPPPPMGRAGRAPLPLKRWSSCSASSSRTCCRWPAAPLRARLAPCLRTASERAKRPHCHEQ